MKLIVKLRNSRGQYKNIQWSIRNLGIAARWANMLKTTPRQNQNYHSEFDWWMAGYTQEHFDKIVSAMSTVCARLNAEKGFDIPAHWFENISRESLNQLHLEFHELAESAPNDSDVNQLNYIVHNAESCLSNIKWNKKFSNLIVNFNVFAQEPLLDSDYLEFQHYSIPPGSLILGYDTIGKNLFHCYVDQDVDLMQRRMVRPKITLTSAVNCYINGMLETQEPQNYYKWCDDNSVLDAYGYDCRLPQHSGGQCIIGDPVDWDADGLTEWLLDSSGVHVHHWVLED